MSRKTETLKLVFGHFIDRQKDTTTIYLHVDPKTVYKIKLQLTLEAGSFTVFTTMFKNHFITCESQEIEKGRKIAPAATGRHRRRPPIRLETNEQISWVRDNENRK